MNFAATLLSLVLCATAALAEPAIREPTRPAEATASLTLGLRSGFDSNPADSIRPEGSLFAGHSFSLDYAAGAPEAGLGLRFVSLGTFYDPRVLSPALSNTITLAPVLTLAPGVVLRGTLEAAGEQTWSRRRNDVSGKLRLDVDEGAVRLFNSLELRAGGLNERNYFANGGFLPRDENSATIGMLPGLAFKGAFGEVGTSLTLSQVRYLEQADYIGLRRDTVRVQPNLFTLLRFGAATFEGSASLLKVRFPDKDFRDITRFLYSARLTWPLGRFGLQLSSTRGVQETTLPFSVVDVADLHEARLSFDWTPKDVVSLVLRQKSDNYLGLFASATTRSIGMEYVRRLRHGLALTAGVALRRVRQTGAEIPDAVTVLIGIQKQTAFGAGAGKEPTGS